MTHRQFLSCTFSALVGGGIAWFAKPGSGGSGTTRDLSAPSQITIFSNPISSGSGDPHKKTDDEYFHLAAHSNDGSNATIQFQNWALLLDGINTDNAERMMGECEPLARRGTIPMALWTAMMEKFGTLAGDKILSKLPENFNAASPSFDSLVKGWVVSGGNPTEWYARLGSGHYRNMAAKGILRALSVRDPREAEKFFWSVDPTTRREQGAHLVEGIKDSRGPKAALEWLDQFYNNTLQSKETAQQAITESARLSNSLISSCKMLPGMEQAKLLMSYRDKPWLGQEVWSKALARAQWDDLGGTLDWVANLDPAMGQASIDTIQEAALDAVMTQRARADNNVGKWLNQHPDHPLFEQFAERFVYGAYDVDAAAANEWARQLRTPEIQNRVQEWLQGRELEKQ